MEFKINRKKVLFMFCLFVICMRNINAFVIRSEGIEHPTGYPFMVSLQYRNVHFCSGTILDKSHVLTAAHYFNATKNITKDISELRVVTNTAKLNDTAKMIEKKVKSVIIHEHFNGTTFDNDIAIIKIKDEFQFDNFTSPVILARSNSTLLEKDCVILGWDYISKNISEVSYELKEPNLEKKNCTDSKENKTCVYFYRDNDLAKANVSNPSYELRELKLKIRNCSHATENQTCVYGHSNGDLAKDDSGGPLICNALQIGIILSADNHYTDIVKHRVWIEARVNGGGNGENGDDDDNASTIRIAIICGCVVLLIGGAAGLRYRQQIAVLLCCLLAMDGS